MARERISTTVDAGNLARARALLSKPDSEVIDQALLALIDRHEAEHEASALEKFPYEKDPDLAWEAPAAPSLEYLGNPPAAVLELAAKRRKARTKK